MSLTHTYTFVVIYFKEVLEDDKIVKVGVVPEEDAELLKKDYGVQTKSTLDLRHMANLIGLQPRSLKIMAGEYLNVKLLNNKRISNAWENETLSQKQIDYAAKDAHVAIELFKFFANKFQPKKALEDQKTYLQSIIDNQFEIFLNKMFKYVSPGTNSVQIENVARLEECRSWLKIFKL